MLNMLGVVFVILYLVVRHRLLVISSIPNLEFFVMKFLMNVSGVLMLA